MSFKVKVKGVVASATSFFRSFNKNGKKPPKNAETIIFINKAIPTKTPKIWLLSHMKDIKPTIKLTINPIIKAIFNSLSSILKNSLVLSVIFPVKKPCAVMMADWELIFPLIAATNGKKNIIGIAFWIVTSNKLIINAVKSSPKTVVKSQGSLNLTILKT